MKGLLLVLIVGCRTLLCRGIVLGIILLLFWYKGRQLQFDSDRWDDFFLSLSPHKVRTYGAWIYLIAAAIASGISYAVLKGAGYRHSFAIAAVLFAGGWAATAYQWKKKGDAFFRRRFQEMHNTIRKKEMRNQDE